MKIPVLLLCILFALSSSNLVLPPKELKKDVKEVCSCYQDFIKLEQQKDFPKSSPYYQEARAKALTSIVQVEKHIQDGKYNEEEFNAYIKKKCPDMIKAIRDLTSGSAQN
ncbi:MAG: hypothetical protein KDC84_08095 [Crocinitomicaceae bacterium]|nr:hypothetical protein [Crocinitomicaceae bacterium]